MAVPFITAKSLAAFALESTRGTAATVNDAAFNVRIRDITCDPEIEAYVREFASARHSIASPVMGRKKGTIKFRHDLQLGAAAGTAPTSSKLWNMCGLLETVVGATSVTYTPDPTKDSLDSYCGTGKFLLIPATGNAVLVSFKGMMGNAVIKMEGSILVVDFDMMGCFTSIADGTALALTSPNTTVPPVAVAGATITHASVAQQISKMELDFGNTVELEIDPSDATGYKAAYISKRRPKLRIDPQAKLVADDAHYTRWAAGTQAAFSLATATSGGLKATLSAPKAALMANKIGDRAGAAIWDQEYDLGENSGADEWSLAISA